ncbi:hypothetical protein ACFL6H_02190 [Candidatus Latescibacterota bacterium]
MDELLNKLKVKIDYEKQLIDKLKSNPYEISVAISKYAREVNEKARKYFGSNVDIMPRNLAMKKIEGEKFKIVYPENEHKEEE